MPPDWRPMSTFRLSTPVSCEYSSWREHPFHPAGSDFQEDTAHPAGTSAQNNDWFHYEAKSNCRVLRMGSCSWLSLPGRLSLKIKRLSAHTNTESTTLYSHCPGWLSSWPLLLLSAVWLLRYWLPVHWDEEPGLSSPLLSSLRTTVTDVHILLCLTCVYN